MLCVDFPLELVAGLGVGVAVRAVCRSRGKISFKV